MIFEKGVSRISARRTKQGKTIVVASENSAYQNSLTSSDFEPDPVIDLDQLSAGDDDWRENILYAETWLSYGRPCTLVHQEELEVAQEETNRPLLHMHADFNLATLRDNDLVRVDDCLYSGFDLKRLLNKEGAIARLLGSGPVIPHVCAKPEAKTNTKSESADFWRTNGAIVLAIAATVVAESNVLIAWFDLKAVLAQTFQGAAVPAVLLVLGIIASAGGITMVCSELRYRMRGSIAPLWAITVWLCLTAGLSGLVWLALGFMK